MFYYISQEFVFSSNPNTIWLHMSQLSMSITGHTDVIHYICAKFYEPSKDYGIENCL
jgi:hypothetical protein